MIKNEYDEVISKKDAEIFELNRIIKTQNSIINRLIGRYISNIDDKTDPSTDKEIGVH